MKQLIVLLLVSLSLTACSTPWISTANSSKCPSGHHAYHDGCANRGGQG